MAKDNDFEIEEEATEEELEDLFRPEEEVEPEPTPGQGRVWTRGEDGKLVLK